ncbi:MAG: aminoacyl-tRNA hydrolase [Endomicrobiales bacterium]|nr:aminoacyl-tRNA hydrolase [Endomicrobiales bacterium]
MDEIKLIVGLGNPGKKYHMTRHNLGFMVVDFYCEKCGISLKKWSDASQIAQYGKGKNRIIFAKPQVFMNNSGASVAELLNFFKIGIAETLVILDDFSIPLGALRLRRSGSCGGHNGLASIINLTGTKEFPRLRLGIGPVPERADPADFVLSPFEKREKETAAEMVSGACGVLGNILDEGIEKAMSRMPAVRES